MPHLSPRQHASLVRSRTLAAVLAVLLALLACIGTGIGIGTGAARADSPAGPADGVPLCAAPADANTNFHDACLHSTDPTKPSQLGPGGVRLQQTFTITNPSPYGLCPDDGHYPHAPERCADHNPGLPGIFSAGIMGVYMAGSPTLQPKPPNLDLYVPAYTGPIRGDTCLGGSCEYVVTGPDNLALPLTVLILISSPYSSVAGAPGAYFDDGGDYVNEIAVTITGEPTPTAAFTVNPITTHPGEYQFVSDSTSPDGSALDYHWEFGDGTTGTGVTVVHNYAKPGTFSATLRVTSSTSGQSASASHSVTVDPPALQTALAFVDTHGTVLSSVSPKIGDTVHLRLTVSTSSGVGSISSITFPGGVPLVVTPSAAATIGSPSTMVPTTLTLKPNSSFRTTFPAKVLTRGLARYTAKPSGKDAAGRTVTGGTGQNSYSVSGMTATITVTPSTFALKEDAHGPKPVDVTVTETIKNTTGAPLTNVVLQSLEPQRTSVGELLAVTYKSGTNPADPKLNGNGLPLADIPAGGQVVVTAVYTVSDDGKVDFTSLVTAAAVDGSTVRAVAKSRLEATPKYYLKVDSHVVSPTRGLLPAGSSIVITGRVTNLTDANTETIAPLYAQVEGNAGLQSFVWNTTGADPKALDTAKPITLGPGEKRDFTLKVLTAYSEPVVGASPLTRKPVSGGTRAIIRFTPWVTVTREDGTKFDTNKVDTAGTEDSTGDILSSTTDLTHTVSIDDSIALPGSDPFATASGVFVGTIQGVWNGAAGMVTGLIALPQMSVSTLLAIVQYQDRVWRSFTPKQQQEFSHLSGTLALSGAVLYANYEFAKQGLPTLERKIGDSVYQYFTKVENESRVGNYTEMVRLYTSFAVDAFTQAALPVALGQLAKSRAAVAALDAAAEAQDASAAGVVGSVSDTSTVEQAYKSVHDVSSGVNLAAQSVTRMFGIAPTELAKLQALADKYKVLMVVRSRAASSLKWIEEFAALLKPEAIKIKSVSSLDVSLGYDAAWEGSLVFKEPQPLIELRNRGGSLTDLMTTFVESRGFTPGTTQYDNAMARVSERVKEWQKWSETYRQWDKQKWVDTSFNWKGNAMSDPTVRGSGRFSGFRLVPVEGQESTYVMKMYNPKTGTYVPITGDIDPIAFTHVDGTPLTREEHATLVNEMRLDPDLQAQHGESATYVEGGIKFIEGQFKAGEAALMLAPGKMLARTVRFDTALSIWRSPLDYHLVWDGGFVDAGANPASRGVLRLLLDADAKSAVAAVSDKVHALPGNGTSTEPNVGRCSVTYDASATATFMTAGGRLNSIEGSNVRVSPLEAQCMRDGPVIQVRVSPGTVSTGNVSAGAIEIPITGGSAYGQKSDGSDGFQVGQTVLVDPDSAQAETARIADFGSIILDHPLRHDHPAGTVIVTIRAAPTSASSPGIATTGVPDGRGAVALGLGSLAVGAMLTAAGASRRRRYV